MNHTNKDVCYRLWKLHYWFLCFKTTAHPNCRLFITHGGIHSLLEAVHFNVPILGVPVFPDQFMNMPLAEECGFGKMIRLEQITVESLFLAIQESRCRIKHKVSLIFFATALYSIVSRKVDEKASKSRALPFSREGVCFIKRRKKHLNLIDHFKSGKWLTMYRIWNWTPQYTRFHIKI